MSLFDECLDGLGEKVKILSDFDKQELVKTFKNSIPFTKWGRVDWSMFSKKFKINSMDELFNYLDTNLSSYSLDIYIIWDEVTLDVVKSDLIRVLEVLDDVLAVSFDTWL